MFRLLGRGLTLLFGILIVGFAINWLRAPDSQIDPTGIFFSGTWKQQCSDESDLRIEEAGPNRYTLTFCGPGGCGDPSPPRNFSERSSIRVLGVDRIAFIGPIGIEEFQRCKQD